MAEVSLNGMDDLFTALQRMGDAAKRIENQALKAGAEVVRDKASENARRSSKNKAHLADNIAISRVKTKDGIKYIEIGPQKGDNSEFFYGKFLEWGTSKMPAYPFMGPAAVEASDEAVEKMANVIRAGLGL